MIADGLVIMALLGLLGIFFIIQLKMMFFPQIKGEIIEFESIFDPDCKSCRGKNEGKTSLPIKVKTDDGKIISAEISACTMCIEGIGIGSRIGVTKVGSRHIAQACANIRGRNN
ncbi:MAG: hypothetical protein JSV56_09265 [Methanomassiliicoccales archaeon]|nr:MAG: hypothetical protein JSV56_09265 [Methanomassiliicoccales archaeon]